MTKKKYNDALVLHLEDFFRRKGITKPIGWMHKQGIPNNTAHKLLHGKFKRGIPMYHLATICQKLYCTPNDLFNYNPLPADDVPGHPLQALKREPEKEDINKILIELPPEKLDEAKRLLKELKG